MPTQAPAADFTESEEPFALFGQWYAAAEASEPNDPNAMCLATVDAQGAPNNRMVLLKGAGAAAADWHRFLLSPTAQAVFVRHGYALPQ